MNELFEGDQSFRQQLRQFSAPLPSSHLDLRAHWATHVQHVRALDAGRVVTRESNASRSHYGRRLGAAISFAVVIALLVGYLVADSHSGNAKPIRQPVASRGITLSSWRISTAIPSGTPGQLVPDPSGNAVWWWGAANDGDAYVYRFDTSTHRLADWSLGNVQSHNLETGDQSGFAVGKSGVIWVGTNLELVRLDTKTGDVRFIDMPLTNPQGHGGLPPPVTSWHAIEALAANASGDIAIVVSASQKVFIYHSASGTFSSLSVATGTMALDAAYLPNGTLGVAVDPDRGEPGGSVLIVSPGGHVTIAGGIEGGFILPDHDRFLVGEDHLFWVYPNGHVSPGTGSEASVPVIAYASPPTWPLSNGHIISLAKDYESLVDLKPDGPSQTVVLARRPCGPVAIGGPPGGPGPPQSNREPPTTSTTLVCHTGVFALTALGDSVWYLESFNQEAFIWRVNGA